MPEIHRVSDIAIQIKPFEGGSVKVRSLINKEFVITRIVKLTGDNGPYVGVQIVGEGKPFFFFSSHVVIMRKLIECMGSEPLLAKIKKVEVEGDANWYFDIE